MLKVYTVLLEKARHYYTNFLQIWRILQYLYMYL